MPANQVVVSLTEKTDGHTPRRITLDERNDFCLLGRASRKGADIVAQPDNGYFENPVVSRNHAEIRADFAYERVYVKDIGSTHGTFINNVRIPATVRHPIRSGDNITLGVQIKGQGQPVGEPVQPSVMTVGVKFGTKPSAGTNVFQVPDETSVEGSDPEDTLGRARPFLYNHGNQSAYNAIDLTNDGLDGNPVAFDFGPPLPYALDGRHSGFDHTVGGRVEVMEPFGVATDVAGPPKDEGKNEDGDLELPAESDLSESEAEDYSEDDVEEEEDDDAEGDMDDEIDEDMDDDVDDEAEDDEDDVAIMEEYEYSPEPSCACALVDNIDPSASNGAANESDAPGRVGQATSPDIDDESEDDYDSSQPDEDTSPLTEDSSLPEKDVSPPARGLSQPKEDTSPRLHAEAAGQDEATGGHSTTSKKRKASEISKGEEHEAVTNVLSASGVQTDPSVEREPKRLRRAADIVGYTALGGLAGALAVFTTLVLSAPSFS